MAVQLEFINLIIPISIIEDKYPGGWLQCLDDYQDSVGHSVWFDEHLLRCGAMNNLDIRSMLHHWQALGFNTHEEVNGKGKWREVCVVEAMFADEKVSCDWIVIDEDVAYLKGTAKGDIVGPTGYLS